MRKQSQHTTDFKHKVTSAFFEFFCEFNTVHISFSRHRHLSSYVSTWTKAVAYSFCIRELLSMNQTCGVVRLLFWAAAIISYVPADVLGNDCLIFIKASRWSKKFNNSFFSAAAGPSGTSKNSLKLWLNRTGKLKVDVAVLPAYRNVLNLMSVG